MPVVTVTRSIPSGDVEPNNSIQSLQYFCKGKLRHLFLGCRRQHTLTRIYKSGQFMFLLKFRCRDGLIYLVLKFRFAHWVRRYRIHDKSITNLCSSTSTTSWALPSMGILSCWCNLACEQSFSVLNLTLWNSSSPAFNVMQLHWTLYFGSNTIFKTSLFELAFILKYTGILLLLSLYPFSINLRIYVAAIHITFWKIQNLAFRINVPTYRQHIISQYILHTNSLSLSSKKWSRCRRWKKIGLLTKTWI